MNQWCARILRESELTAAYATATFAKLARVDHHVALVKAKTKMQPTSPNHAIQGWKIERNVYEVYADEGLR